MELFNKKTDSGVSSLFAIALMLSIGFIGTGLLKMGHNDILSGVDYYAATKARLAAKAGVQKFEHFVENLPDSIVSVLEQFVFDTATSVWVLGDGDEYDSLDSNLKFRVEAVGVDDENFVMHIISHGKAGNSTKDIHAQFSLGNLEIARSASAEQDFALYIGSVSSFSMIGPIDIDGNVMISGNIDFDAAATGSRFRGLFRTTEENNSQLWQGTYTFDTLAYFGTAVRGNGNLEMNFMDKSAFEVRPSATGSNNNFNFHDDTWFNKNGTGASIDFWLNHNNVSHTSAFSFNSGTWHDVGTEMLSPENPMDIADSVGLNAVACMPDIDESAIPSAKKYQWSTLRNPSGWASPSPLAPYVDPGWDQLDGNMANKIWDLANSQNKLWYGYAVIEADHALDFVDGGTFSKKLIILIQNGITVDPTAAGKMFPTTPTANLVFYIGPGGKLANIGNWDFIRGYIYCDSGATLEMGGGAGATFDALKGAIHIQDNATVSWYPTVSGVPTVTYDYTVISDLMNDGFIEFSCGTSDTTITLDSISFIQGFDIVKTLRGMHY